LAVRSAILATAWLLGFQTVTRNCCFEKVPNWSHHLQTMFRCLFKGESLFIYNKK